MTWPALRTTNSVAEPLVEDDLGREARVAAAEDRDQRPLAVGERRAVVDVLPRMLRLAGDEALVAAAQLAPRAAGVDGRSVGCSLTAGPLTAARRWRGRARWPASELLGSGRAEQHEGAVAGLGREAVARRCRRRRRVAVVVHRPLDAVDAWSVPVAMRALEQLGHPRGVRLEALVHADVLVARREVARRTRRSRRRPWRCAARRRWRASPRAARARRAGRRWRSAPARRSARRRCRAPSARRCAARRARSRARRAGSRRARARGSAASGAGGACASSRPCGPPSPRASRGGRARRRHAGASAPSASAAVVGCRGRPAPGPRACGVEPRLRADQPLLAALRRAPRRAPTARATARGSRSPARARRRPARVRRAPARS